MKVNYVIQYKNNFIEFDRNSLYYIVEINSSEFDKYWNEFAYINESFEIAAFCKRIENYRAILDEIKNNTENQIAYPIIAWVDEKNIKISQGRHRIRAIIDSGQENIQLAIKEEYYKYLKDKLTIRIIKSLEVTNNFEIFEK